MNSMIMLRCTQCSEALAYSFGPLSAEQITAMEQARLCCFYCAKDQERRQIAEIHRPSRQAQVDTYEGGGRR